jgi:hypothetical protein
MQIIFRGCLKEKQASAYRDWLAKNHDALQDHAPPGWKYAGTYFTVMGFGKFDVENRWELSSYGALDAARDHEDETLDKLILEQTEFFEPTIPGETYLMRSAEDVRIRE